MEYVDSTCTDCGKTYSSQKKLEKHGECVHTLLKCDECNKQVVGYKKMKNHKQNHVMKVCQNCDIVFSMNVLASHMKVCSSNDGKKLFSCDQCDYKTTVKKNLVVKIIVINTLTIII